MHAYAGQRDTLYIDTWTGMLGAGKVLIYRIAGIVARSLGISHREYNHLEDQNQFYKALRKHTLLIGKPSFLHLTCDAGCVQEGRFYRFMGYSPRLKSLHFRDKVHTSCVFDEAEAGTFAPK